MDAREAELLRSLNESLHELSQPVTVLLCTLEYGSNLDSMKEMRETMATSKEACERLRKTVHSMQAQVREATEARAAKENRVVAKAM